MIKGVKFSAREARLCSTVCCYCKGEKLSSKISIEKPMMDCGESARLGISCNAIRDISVSRMQFNRAQSNYLLKETTSQDFQLTKPT
jgi:hypothetical protein